MTTTINPKNNGKLLVMADTDIEHLERFLSYKHLICDALITEKTDSRVNIYKNDGSFCMQEPYINIESEPDASDTLIMYNTKYSKSFINSYMECIFDTIMEDALQSGARMVVLETQSYNSKAIVFYKKNGFEIIGFDLFAYSNEDPEEHNMRVEMGKRL